MAFPSENSIILQDNVNCKSRWIAFEDPLEVLTAEKPGEVQSVLEAAEKLSNEGKYIAGFLSYEASQAFDDSLATRELSGFPYAWFGVYKGFREVDLNLNQNVDFILSELQPCISKNFYHKAIDSIKSHIFNGDTYQVNYTFLLRGKYSGNPWGFFTSLFQAQNSKYSAYVDIGRYKICSVSPELFISVAGGEVCSKPMKGTSKRGIDLEEDALISETLHFSGKNRAENVMIVDMIRNDMGRVAKTGTVTVEKLFSVEKYPTVFQMTSTVKAAIDGSVFNALKHMFPCASITGAPKVKTMEIIKNLEVAPRGVYTGSIGYIAPNGNSQFNVAIRTLVADIEKEIAEYGVGGGITWYSSTEDEYEECYAKASVLTHKVTDFQIFETMLWHPGYGYYLLDEHIERLKRSCDYFDFLCSEDKIRQVLQAYQIHFPQRRKVKISISKAGEIDISSAPISSFVGNKVGVALNLVKSESIMLYHKTTQRAVYERALASRKDCQDVILVNTDGFVTESTIANIVIKRNGKYVTPPLKSGLLPGVMRRCLLGSDKITESDIHIDELLAQEDFYLINSVRGWMHLIKNSEDELWTLHEESLVLEGENTQENSYAKLGEE